MKKTTYIQVAVPSPLRQTFDYRLPPDIPVQSCNPGMRVLVPFGKRKLVGLITATSHSTTFPEDRIKPAEKLIDAAPVIDATLLDLYRWAADYYMCPIGQALQTSLPSQIRKGLPAIERKPPCWQLTGSGKSIDIDILRKAPRQQQVLVAIGKAGKIAQADLTDRLGFQVSAVLKTLAEKGLIEETVEAVEPGVKPASLYGPDKPLPLNAQQQAALDAIRARGKVYHTCLLEGITGSGKTEIYLQAIADYLARNEQVLVLVPEISLTPQTVRRFQQRFDRHVVVLHSGLTDTQRMSAWLQAGNGQADIIIGTRSAIFTPLARPGLIIVDEEHDASYKQQDGFRYSGRDLAIFRARQLDIPAILGTATPSLESLNNALAGRYQYLTLTERAGSATHPVYRLLDLKGQAVTDGFAGALVDMIRSHLDQGNQVLIFLNRRGFSPILLCRDCGWIANCDRCDTSFTLHKQPPVLSCHHCDSRRPVPGRCPACGGADLAAMGLGTEKTEQVLQQLFPAIPVYRIDRDSTRNRDALHGLIDKVDQGDPCILVGTQMLSKGHHFPNVTLVAVLDADGGLFSADFRGQEHTGQLLTQVAGRAGRGSSSGEVVIQTYNSTHPTLQALVHEGYNRFARKLLEERRQGRLPPFTFMALLRAEAGNRMLPEKFLGDMKKLAQANGAGLRIIGPMPAFMEKRAGQFRFQLILEAGNRPALQQRLAQLVSGMEAHPDTRKLRWSVDVDPLDFT